MATDESTNERPSERRRDENEQQITYRKAEEIAGVGEGDIPERALKGIIQELLGGLKALQSQTRQIITKTIEAATQCRTREGQRQNQPT